MERIPQKLTSTKAPAKRARVVSAPRQDGCRVVVLGLVLFRDHVALHAVVEVDSEEIETPVWRQDEVGMFVLSDNLGTPYRVRSGGCFVDPGRHIRDWSVTIDPAAPEGATEFTVTHTDGSVQLAL
jgi:hypothetical protein